jgi:hypothetical protein
MPPSHVALDYVAEIDTGIRETPSRGYSCPSWPWGWGWRSFKAKEAVYIDLKYRSMNDYLVYLLDIATDSTMGSNEFNRIMRLEKIR